MVAGFAGKTLQPKPANEVSAIAREGKRLDSNDVVNTVGGGTQRSRSSATVDNAGGDQCVKVAANAEYGYSVMQSEIKVLGPISLYVRGSSGFCLLLMGRWLFRMSELRLEGAKVVPNRKTKNPSLAEVGTCK
jgi:hypothetical protein